MAKDKGGQPKVPAYILEIAALKARISQATLQSQQVVNLLAKYGEGLGRVLQLSRIVVDREAEVAGKHGPCPDVELGGFIKELRKTVYDMMPKPKEEEPADDAEEADAAGEGEPERPADGGVDAPGKGQAPEGAAAPEGAEAAGGAVPEADAAPRQAG